MRIGVIGTGSIASAVVTGIAGDGHQLTVSERSAVRAAGLAQRHDCVTIAANQTVLDQSDVIFLGLMADAAPGILQRLAFRPDHRILSLMAGATLAEVAAMVGPARAEAIVIPFPGIAQGGSPVLVQGDTGLARRLFGAANRIFALSSDAEMDAYMCAQAILSPVVRMVGDAAAWLAGRTDDAAQAEAFLRVLVGTSLIGSECRPLLEALNTPGGYNQRLREHMVASGMSTAIAAGLEGLARR